MTQERPAHNGQGVNGPAIGARRVTATVIRHRASLSVLFGFMGILAMLVSLCAPALAAVAPAGTVIDSKGYFSNASHPAAVASNTVRVIVQGVESFTLVDNRQTTALPGAQVTFSHTLTNTGNTVSSYTLTLANLAGDGFDIENITLYRNIDSTGVVSPTDPVIPHGGTVTLNPGETATLIVTGTVPPGTAGGLEAKLKVSVITALQHVAAANTDTITVKVHPVISLVKTASVGAAKPGDQVTYTVTGTNTGGMPAAPTSTYNGAPLTVGGNPAQLVLIHDAIPANTAYVAGSLVCSAGVTPLYHRSGDPPVALLASEPEAVDELFCGGPALPPNAAMSLSFKVAISSFASTKIQNTAEAAYVDGVISQNVSSSSNRSLVDLPSVPPAIDFFTDRTFNRIAHSTNIGEDLFIQASAAMCNIDPLTAERKTVNLTSTLTGDVESFDAVETGPNTGIFRILSSVPTQDANATPMKRANNIMEVLKNDQLTASINGCGSASATANILVDPFGIIFDSKTGVPIDGATVTLVDAGGRLAVVKGEDGLSDFPSTITSGSTVKDSSGRAYDFPPGGFLFPLVPSGTYRLQVLPPNGYSFPSKVSPALLPPGHAIDTGSYGGPIVVNALVRIDVPVDPAPRNGLFVEKISSVDIAEMGDFVDYSVRMKNGTGKNLGRLIVRDTLPAGFQYLPGSTRLGGNRVADPEGGRGPTLVFPMGGLDDGNEVTFTYRVKIGPGAFQGNGINYAQASDAAGTVSNVAEARVKVVGGVFSDKGFIVGKVFTDCNRDRIQGAEEPGIPGVRLFMEDGTFVITDSEGKFSLYNISPRTHVLKVDKTTLPAGAELIELANRNAGDAGSLFIDMKSGELHKANFAEGSCNETVMKDVRERRARGEAAGAESDRALAKPLAFPTAPAPQGDVRGLPATGLVGGDASGSSPVPTEKQVPTPTPAMGQKQEPAARTLSDTGPGTVSAQAEKSELPTLAVAEKKAALAGISTLEEDLANGDNSLGFLNLTDKVILPIAQTSVRIKGPAGGTLKLLLNGVEVPDKQMGKKTVNNEKRVEGREYFGIDLRSGNNILQVLLIDPFGNNRGERTIHVTAPGKLDKIVMSIPEKEFSADGHTALPVTVRLLDENGVPYKTRTTVTLQNSLGKWEVTDLDDKEPGLQVAIKNGVADFKLQPPVEPGEVLIKCSAGSNTTESRVYFYPNLRPMMAAGLVEGTINLRNLGGSALQPARNQDGFEKEISAYSFSGDNGKTQAGARAAMYLKGKIKGDYLLTLSYDSDKDTRDTLFRDIQPDQFYPVYGDSSVKGFDAQSSGKFYVRIDKNRSYLLYGDYITPPGGDVRVLGAYNRSLNGASGHYENGSVTANAFASRDTTRQVIDELPAQGLSGPYFLTKTDFIANSEKVEIITRDRNQPSLVLQSVPQARFTDYEIEDISGRILFKAPVPTLDAGMNPNYIRVTYETDQGGDQFWVAGVDAQAKLHPRLEVGASYVRDENPVDKADLKSANATVKLFAKTFLLGEWAEGFKDSIGRGDAGRLELRHDGEKLQARVYGVLTDSGFANPNSTYGQGRKEAGAKLTYKAGQSTTISGEALHSEDSITGGKKDGVLATIQHSFGPNLQGEVGVRYARESTAPSQPEGVAPNEVTSIRTKLTGKIPQLQKLSLTGEYEQSLNYGDRRMAAGGAEYQISTVGKLYARHEFISSLTGPYDLNGSQQQNSTQVGIDTEYMKNGKVFSEYRVRDAIAGRDAEAAIGLRNGWELAKGIKLSTTLERIQKLDGATDTTATAVTGALDYTASPLWKGTARVEVRTATTSNTLLNTLGVAYKMSRNITLLGRQFLSYTDNKGSSGDLVQERFQTGFAYRPTDTDTWNVLSRYEFKYEENGGLADLAVKRQVHILSTHLNYQPEKALTMSARYAGKLVVEDSNGMNSRSNTHLLSGRTIYDLTSKWDVGLNYSALFSDFFKSCRYGIGGEVGYLMATNLWLSSGYNILGFKDKDLSAEEYTAQGVYFRLRFKFDEDLFAGKDPTVNKTLPMKVTAGNDR